MENQYHTALVIIVLAFLVVWIFWNYIKKKNLLISEDLSFDEYQKIIKNTGLKALLKRSHRLPSDFFFSLTKKQACKAIQKLDLIDNGYRESIDRYLLLENDLLALCGFYSYQTIRKMHSLYFEQAVEEKITTLGKMYMEIYLQKIVT